MTNYDNTNEELNALKEYINKKYNNETKLELVRNFNTIICKLINLFDQLSPNNPDVIKLQNYIRIFKSYDNELIIKEVGPYLFKYRIAIYNNNDSILNGDTIREELKLYDNRKLTDEEKLAIGLFTTAANLFVHMNNEEKIEIFKSIQKTLDYYLMYVIKFGRS